MDNLRNYNHLLVDSGLDELGKDSNQIKEKIQEPENSSIKDEFVKKILILLQMIMKKETKVNGQKSLVKLLTLIKKIL